MRPRIIPVLQIENRRAVKTVQFANPDYVGDPINIVRLFNEMEADEIIILDIGASRTGRIDFDYLERLASECFMPAAYGGGLRGIEKAQRVLAAGFEKVVFSSALFYDGDAVKRSVHDFGAQSVITSLDIKRQSSKYWFTAFGGKPVVALDLIGSLANLARLRIGEIMIHDVDRDGTRRGYDLELIRSVADAVNVPVIACGGAKDYADLQAAIDAGASAAAAGSLFVYRDGPGSVLVNYPERASR